MLWDTGYLTAFQLYTAGLQTPCCNLHCMWRPKDRPVTTLFLCSVQVVSWKVALGTIQGCPWNDTTCSLATVLAMINILVTAQCRSRVLPDSISLASQLAASRGSPESACCAVRNAVAFWPWLRCTEPSSKLGVVRNNIFYGGRSRSMPGPLLCKRREL